MEWKILKDMEYGQLLFHSIACPAINKKEILISAVLCASKCHWVVTVHTNVKVIIILNPLNLIS